MSIQLSAIAPPGSGVYRLARRRGDIFVPPPWERASHEDGTFSNRFDDPGLADGIGTEDRFRVIYCATSRACALMELTASFRPSVSAFAALRAEIEDSDEARPERLSFAMDRHGLPVGLLPAKWRMRRKFGHGFLDPSLRFADLGATATLNHLRRAMADVVVELGLDDIDLSAVTGPHRKLTQRIARYVYEQVDDEGTPRFAGIRYLSHHGDNQECWALFDTRIVLRETIVELNILPDDEDLMVVARMFGLTVEVLDGQYLRP